MMRMALTASGWLLVVATSCVAIVQQRKQTSDWQSQTAVLSATVDALSRESATSNMLYLAKVAELQSRLEKLQTELGKVSGKLGAVESATVAMEDAGDSRQVELLKFLRMIDQTTQETKRVAPCDRCKEVLNGPL